jgi:cytochrome c2
MESIDMQRSRRVLAPIWITFHAVILVVLAAIPTLKFGVPFWELTDNELLAWALLTAAYLVSALIPGVNWLRRKSTRLGAIALSTLGVFALVLLALRLAEIESSRVILLGAFTAALVLIPLSFGDRRIIKPVAAMLAVIGIVALGYRTYGTSSGTHSSMVQSSISTGHYNLRELTYDHAIKSPAVRGGGIARIDDRYLLITGDGRLNVFGWTGKSDALEVNALPYRVPINGEEFSAAAGVPYQGPPGGAGEMQGSARNVQNRWFRVAGVLVQQIDNRVHVFASHHFWKKSEACFVVQVSVLDEDLQMFLSGSSRAAWKTLYETKPCLSITGEDRRRGTPFAGLFQGGRMVLLDAHTLLLTVGDHGFDVVNAKQNFPQDLTASYGKTVRIHLDDGSSEIYTSGHRNPQGLFKDSAGTLWETEQGPRGGDELNVLAQGKNYGWPFITYGTDYSSLLWPLHAPGNDESVFEPPLYAWQPSIATSNLIRIEQDRFSLWKGDLLVASLAAESLWRVHLRQQHVVLIEPIHIGSRIRDLIEGPDGRLVLWTDNASLISLSPESGTSDQLVFDTRCGGCHRVADEDSHSIGPDLYGVFGRQIAAAEGYQDYSPALKSLKGNWTQDRLDTFLSNPQSLAQGTSMEFPGVQDAAERQAIVRYLSTLK